MQQPETKQVRIGLCKKSWTHVLRGLHSFINHPVHERDRLSLAMLKPLPLSHATRQLRSGMSAAACLLLCRVSDAGHERRRPVHLGRRPKAAKERTRGRWCAEGAAQLAMGIWLRRRARGKERDGLGRERYCGWEPAEAWVDGGCEPWRRLIEACVDGRAAQSAERNRTRLMTSGRRDR